MSRASATRLMVVSVGLPRITVPKLLGKMPTSSATSRMVLLHFWQIVLMSIYFLYINNMYICNANFYYCRYSSRLIAHKKL